MSFLPPDYTIPKTPSKYMKFDEGLNSIRILSSAIVGYEYFTNENKPVRSRTQFESTPNIKTDSKVKPFWAFVVWNNNDKMIQILEITQTTIMFGIQSLVDNPKWGDPKMYDIAITKTGNGKETEYTVQGEPPIDNPSAEVLKAYSETPVNLDALYVNGDPFATDNGVQTDEETISVTDIPY
jgi:hypothetical protein